MFKCKWTCVKKGFSDMILEIFACLVQSLTFTVPHFNDREAIFSYVAVSQFIEFSLLTTKFNNPLSEKRWNLLTETKAMKITNGKENKNHQHWSNHFCSACLLHRHSRFCNLVLFVENNKWPNFQSYGSCFVKASIYLSVDWEPNANQDRWAWVDTSNMDKIG